MARKVREYENHTALPMIKEADAIRVLIAEKASALRAMPEVHRISKILAVDPGTANCAVALICRNAKTGELETVLTTKIVPPAQFTNNAFMQVAYVQKILEQFIVDHVPQLVVKEGEAFDAPMRAHDLGRAHQAIDLACYNTGRPLIIVSPNSAKSYFGAAKKDEMRQKVYRKYGIEFPSPDECDAFALGKTAEAILKGEYPRKKEPKKPKAAVTEKQGAVRSKPLPARKKSARPKKTPLRKKSR